MRTGRPKGRPKSSEPKTRKLTLYFGERQFWEIKMAAHSESEPVSLWLRNRINLAHRLARHGLDTDNLFLFICQSCGNRAVLDSRAFGRSVWCPYCVHEWSVARNFSLFSDRPEIVLLTGQSAGQSSPELNDTKRNGPKDENKPRHRWENERLEDEW